MSWSAAPSAPKFEHRTDAGPVLGVGTASPRLSWLVASAAPGWTQAAYEIEITRDGGRTTHLVAGGEQILVPWPSSPLRSREEASVRVRVSDGESWSDWGAAATVEAGLLHTSDWTGRLISPAEIGGLDDPAPVMSATLDVPGPVRRARLYATAQGVYGARINGRRVDDAVLTPGWTAYEHRLRYHVHDVTSLVHQGHNDVEALLGNGWYRGYLGYLGERALYGDRLALLAQLEVVTEDGTVHVLSSDRSWRAQNSPILVNDLYNGQTTDLRRSTAPVETSAVEELPTDLDLLVAPEGPAIRVTGLLPAQKVWTSPSGRTLVDFGQNAVGWVRLRVRGQAAGSSVVVRHAEVLENGELGTRPLRAARATDTYLLSEAAEAVLEPSLTLHGFRFAEVSGIPGLHADDVEAVLVGSDLRRTGWFASSDPLLNRLHENVVWSTRSNFVDVPTDCPQRDERLGWTGDIQVFAPTASFLFDTAGLLGSWLADLASEQFPDGSVPHVVPNVKVVGEPDPPAAAWGDAAVLVPWTVYERTGDLGVLQRQLPSMRAWVDKIATVAGADRLWDSGFQFGDWLDPTAPPDEPAAAKTDRTLIATAYFFRSASTVSRAAAALGLTDVAQRYAELAAEIRDAFVRSYVTPGGRLVSDAQTAYAVAIEWDLLPTGQRDAAGRRLADLVRQAAFRIATGFVGTPLVCDALTHTGHEDVAYRLLFQTQCPSWLYPVTMGATTTWERWDSMLPDGSINPGGMTSFNHYALGAVADWLHREVAGLASAAPGYRRLLIRPRPGAPLMSAWARHLTPFGEARVEWERTEGRLRLTVTVPVGATAEVYVPGVGEPNLVGHGEHSWIVADPAGEDRGKPDWETATIRDLLDDPQMWARVIAAATANGTIRDGEVQAASILGWCLDEPARQAAQYLAPDDRWPGAADLRRDLVELLAPAVSTL